MTPRTHPAPTRADWHCQLLWLRSLEVVTGHRAVLRLLSEPEWEPEWNDLFARYRSPWRA